MPLPRASVIAAFIAAVWLAPPVGAAELRTIEAPSRYVDPRTVSFNGDHPGELRANVLLPDGYDGERRFPVLFLLHGVGDAYFTWANPERGNVDETAGGLEAIVVMPEADRGFYTNWWNEGRRGDPGWERYYLDELIPLVEERFRVRPGRRWHAVAGLSMGGMGATYLASQRPDYFGSAASFSGFLSIQRPEVEPGLSAVGGVSYEEIFGPRDGFYAAGHNPARVTDNLRATRVYVTTGNGVAQPGVESAPATVVAGGLVEADLRLQAEDFVAAARDSGVDVTYSPELGVHDWPYWRRDLREAIAWGLFKAVPEAPRRWSYRTVAAAGRAWELTYRFARPPATVQTLERSAAGVSGAGSGEVELCDGEGRGFRAALPFGARRPRRTVSVAIATRRVAALRRARGVRVRLGAGQAEEARLELTLARRRGRGVTIARHTVALAAGERRTVTVPLGREALARVAGREGPRIRAIARYGACRGGRWTTAARTLAR